MRPRRLIHVPIVHSLADMGSSSDELRKAYVEHEGREAWRNSRRAIGAFWTDLEQKIAALDFDFRHVRLYQDGLAVCGHEIEIVRDLAGTGSANYRILMTLMDRGAALEGTENPELLLKEYQLLKAGPSATAAVASPQGAAVSALRKILEERDRYIADRIDTTLRPGETGILFLGALHGAIEMLPQSISVTSLNEVVHGGGAKSPQEAT